MAISAIGGYFVLQYRTEQTEVTVKEVKEDVDVLEKFSVEQTMLIKEQTRINERQTVILDKLEKRF